MALDQEALAVPTSLVALLAPMPVSPGTNNASQNAVATFVGVLVVGVGVILGAVFLFRLWRRR